MAIIENRNDIGAKLLIEKDNPAVLKTKGLACADADARKAASFLCKAGKGFFEEKQIGEAKICLEQAMKLASECLNGRSKESPQVYGTSSVASNHTSNGMRIGINSQELEGSHPTSLVKNSEQRRSGQKRQKMERMTNICKNLKRGSADLYQTMIQFYEENFDIKWDDNTESVSEGMKKSLKKSEILMNRDLTLKELADTEKSYVEGLRFVVENVLPVFENYESDSIKSICSSIFSNIKEIYEWHSSVFVDKIEDCLEDHQLLGPTFSQHQDDLCQLYEVYCQNKPNADDILIDQAEEVDLVFQKIETNFTILDYLIKPVQRVMKYQLLLQSIIKYTKKMGEDTKSMEEALSIMEIVPKKVNDKMHLAMITGYQDELNKNELVFQDTLEIAFGSGKTKPRKFRLFLFEEVLLFTETVERPGRLPKYKFVLEAKTRRMGVTKTVQNKKLKFAIWFRKFKSSDIFVCKAETKQLKDSWLQALDEVLSIYGGGISQGMIRSDSLGSMNRVSTKYLRSTKSKSWTAEQFAKQATSGHPREYAMSMKLKESIQTFLMEELMIEEEDRLKEINVTDERTNGIDSFDINNDVKSSHGKRFESIDDKNRDMNSETSETNESISEESSVIVDDNDDDEDNVFRSDIQSSDTASNYKKYIENSLEDSLDNELSVEVKENASYAINNNDNSNRESTSSIGLYDEDKTVSNGHTSSEQDKVIKSDDTPKLRRSIVDDKNRTLRVCHEEGLKKHELDLKNINRSKSLPDNINLSDGVNGGELRLTNFEVTRMRSILAESQFILAQTSSDRSADLYQRSLSVFVSSEQIKELEKEYLSRKELLKNCTSVYQSIKASDIFLQEDDDTESQRSFFSFPGMFSLLESYGDWAAKEDSTSKSIVLYSLAIVSANYEGSWNDAHRVLRKLADLYNAHGLQGDAVDTYIDAHYMDLETGSMILAAKDLSDALKLSVLSRNWAKCRKIESMSMPIVRADPSLAESFEVKKLKFLIEMCYARRICDYDWFHQNYTKICTCEANMKNQTSELNDLFIHLIDHVKEKKHKKSGEVFV